MKIGLTRWCEWRSSDACNVGWGSAGSDGVKSCHDGSAKENCSCIVRVPLQNLDKKAIARLEKLGDIEL